jgi:hypothetical protein
MKSLEGNQSKLRETCESQAKQITVLSEKYCDLEKELQICRRNLSNRDHQIKELQQAVAELRDKKARDAQSGILEKGASVQQKAVPPVVDLVRPDVDSPSAHCVPPPGSAQPTSRDVRAAATPLHEPTPNGDPSTSSEIPWSQVVGNRRKHKPADRNVQSVIGKRADASLKGVSASPRQAQAHFCVYNLLTSVVEDDVKSFCARNGAKVIECRQVLKGRSANSFRLIVSSDSAERVMQEDFWPFNVACRPWVWYTREDSRNGD